MFSIALADPQMAIDVWKNFDTLANGIEDAIMGEAIMYFARQNILMRSLEEDFNGNNYGL